MENVSIDDVLNTVLVPKGLKYSIASEYLIVITKAGQAKVNLSSNPKNHRKGNR